MGQKGFPEEKAREALKDNREPRETGIFPVDAMVAVTVDREDTAAKDCWEGEGRVEVLVARFFTP